MTDTAYTDGYTAAQAGKPQTANPHPWGSTPAAWWLRGWQERTQEQRQERAGQGNR